MLIKELAYCNRGFVPYLMMKVAVRVENKLRIAKTIVILGVVVADGLPLLRAADTPRALRQNGLSCPAFASSG